MRARVFSRGAVSVGAGPSPEDWLSLIRAPDTDWIALKTGFNKYVGVSSTDDGLLMATAEAIGAREKWELVFQDVSKRGLCGARTHCIFRVNVHYNRYSTIILCVLTRTRKVIVMRRARWHATMKSSMYARLSAAARNGGTFAVPYKYGTR
jgi:hypothetical protein